MGRRRRRRNINAEVDDWSPNIDSVLNYVKKFRSMTGKSSNLLEDYLLPPSQQESHYRDGKYGTPVFNLSEAQVNWIYPENVRKSWDFDMDHDKDFSDLDKEFLDSLVPQITPPESYFEKEELDVLHGQDLPLSSAPIDYISRNGI